MICYATRDPECYSHGMVSFFHLNELCLRRPSGVALEQKRPFGYKTSHIVKELSHMIS